MRSLDAPDPLATIEEIIDEARNGRMFILVDDEDRENEGDLVVPAQMATPDAINFMARYGRGLICLALTQARAATLGLTPVRKDGASRFETAFTASIEARTGVTTGISARDRARTIAVAIDSANGREAIASPGHVFPLVARDGGVLIRAGHTEAAVDVARLAGLNPSGVICEIMNEDGTMARMPDLRSFASAHGLKIGTIRDLIAYRRQHDHLVERVTDRAFESEFGGDWTAIVYRNTIDGSEAVVLQKGAVRHDQPTLVRIHNLSLLSDILGEPGPRQQLVQRAMESVAVEGAGFIVLLKPAPQRALVGDSLADKPDEVDMRAYGFGAQILADLGVQEMILLTNSAHQLVALEGYGLAVVAERQIPMTA